MIDDDLIDLISVWRGAELSLSRCEELFKRLECDVEFRQAFVSEIRMLGMLKAVQSTEPRWLALHAELGWGAEWKSLSHDEDSMMAMLQGQAPHRFSRLGRWGGGVVAASILMTILGWFTWSSGLRAVTGWNWPGAAPSSNKLAVVSKLSDVRWETPNGHGPAVGDLLSAGRLGLRSGQADLVFLNGVTLTVEGPAEFDLVSIDRVFCRKGRLRARVPSGVEGFVVASPGSAVVDLGTEFAMNIDSDGKSRVMVFEGAAEASLLGAEGYPRRTQRVEKNKQFEVNPGSDYLAEAAPRPEQFISPGNGIAPLLQLDSAYSSEVMKSRPLSYWRFESASSDGVPNEVPGGPPLRLNGSVRVAASPHTNGRAVFSDSAPDQFMTTLTPWKLPRGSRHAIEFWFMPETIRYATLVGFYPTDAELPKTLLYHHTMLVELMAYPTLSLEKPASVRFLRGWLREVDLFAEDHNLFSQSIYVPKRWHHVVAQRNDKQMELYVNGVRDHAISPENDPPDIFYRLVVGRRTAEPTELSDRRPFVGELDELVVYDHPLSTEEVRSHYRLAASPIR